MKPKCNSCNLQLSGVLHGGGAGGTLGEFGKQRRILHAKQHTYLDLVHVGTLGFNKLNCAANVR